MKMLALYGSPNPAGNSAKLLESFLNGAKESAAGLEIEKYFLNEFNIKGCQACRYCVGREEVCCGTKDDMISIYEAITEAECIAMSSPLYFWGISAQLKSVVDRMYAFLGKGILRGKRLCLLVSGLSPIPNSGYDYVENTFKDICAYVEMELKTLFVPSGEIPVSENAEALVFARKMGIEIIGEIQTSRK